MIQLKTTEDEWHSLHTAVDKARKNAREVKVSRQALVNLLMDQSNILTKMKEYGLTYTYKLEKD